MCKPTELNNAELVDLIVDCINELIERREKDQEKLEQLCEPIRELQDWVRPWD